VTSGEHWPQNGAGEQARSCPCRQRESQQLYGFMERNHQASVFVAVE
jgi:hypothetical protein